MDRRLKVKRGGRNEIPKKAIMGLWRLLEFIFRQHLSSLEIHLVFINFAYFYLRAFMPESSLVIHFHDFISNLLFSRSFFFLIYIYKFFFSKFSLKNSFLFFLFWSAGKSNEDNKKKIFLLKSCFPLPV